jgi:hypothetical protein
MFIVNDKDSLKKYTTVKSDFKKGIDHFPKGNIQYVNFENWNSYMKKISLIISANF